MQNSGDSKRISGCVRLGGKEVYIRGSTENFVGNEITLYDTILVDTCYYLYVCQNSWKIQHQE